MWQNLVGNGLIDAIWKYWSHKRFLSENLRILRKEDGFLACYRCWSSVSSCRYALARYMYRIYNWLLTDVPWLDTRIESGTIVYRYALAGYRYWIWNCRLQICPGWIQESNLELVVNRYALAGYRNRIFELFRYALARYRYRIYNWLLTDVPWLDTGIEYGIVVYRYALAGYRYRIWNQLLTDVPWLDTSIESGTVKKLVEIAHDFVISIPTLLLIQTLKTSKNSYEFLKQNGSRKAFAS